MVHLYQRRLLKELKSAQKLDLPGVTFLEEESSLLHHFYTIQIPNNAIYPTTDVYKLSIEVNDEYPVDSPQVKFIIDPAIASCKIPIHPHIYSNGHICLNLLGNDWTPACSIETIVLSIQSILTNNTVSSRPDDDRSYVRHAPNNPKNTNFVYHDDGV